MIEEIPIKILHDCGHGCWACRCTGEGQHEGSTCRDCKGKGFIGRGEIETTEYVEVKNGRITTEHCWCDECDRDLISIIKEAFDEQASDRRREEADQG